MYKYQDRVFSTAGQPIQGVLVTVYATGTQTLATLYSDNIGTITTNPVSTDSDGHFEFYVANGRYDIAFSGSAIAAPLILTDVDVADPTGYASTSSNNTWTGSNTFSGSLTGSGTNLFTKQITIQTADNDSLYVKPTADVDAVVVTPDADSETTVGFGITNAANNAWTFRARKNGNIDASGTLTTPNVQATTSLTTPKLNNIRYADQFSGATADVKINAAVAALGGVSGIIDARGFGATDQTIAAKVSLGVNAGSGQSVTLLVDRSTRYNVTITNGDPAFLLCGGSAIIGDAAGVSCPNGYIKLATTANCSNIVLMQGDITDNLVGGCLKNIMLSGNTGAVCGDAILGIQNQLQITHIEGVTAIGGGITNTVIVKVYAFGGAGFSCGNVEFHNVQFDGNGGTGNRVVWIGGANSGSLTPVSVGAVSNVGFVGPSAIVHPGAGLPIVTIEAQNGAGGHNVIGGVNFYGIQMESNSNTDIGILVNGAENVGIYGCYGSAAGAAGADLVKLAQPAGTTLDGITIAGVDNQGGWTNTLNNTVTGVVMANATSGRVGLYTYSALSRIQTITDGGAFGAFNGLILAGGAAPTVAASRIGLGSTTATTVGAAGGASAPPATPLGYLIINVAGTQCKVPYYNN